MGWSRLPDLNRRPADYESAALPTELSRLTERQYTQQLAYLQGENMQATDTLILNEQNQTINTSAKDQIKTLFDQFKKELKYLRNLSELTIKSYGEAFDRWQKHVGQIPTERNLSRFVIEMREAGLSITSCNICIRSINSFISWMKEQGHCPQTFSNGKPFKLAKLAEEKKQLRVFSDKEVGKILSFKPSGRNDQRIYALVCTLIDTGIRINEALNLEVSRVDFDNLIITV